MSDGDTGYEVLETLGQGGFGTVYRARFRGEGGFHKEVALKVLNPDMEGVGEVAGRLRDEARVLGLLRHRAIVQVDRLTRIETRWAVVMEYVDGEDLTALLKRGALPLGPALEIVAEVAGALDAAHNQPGPDGAPLRLLHRDIKPSNIRVTPFGEVKVLDFGIARAEFATREAHTRSLAFGTPDYMSPERLDFSADGPEGDVYALGAVLFELLSGHPLGRASANPGRHARKLTEARQALSAHAPPVVLDLIQGALTYEPEQRLPASELERRATVLSRELRQEPLRSWARSNVRASHAPGSPTPRRVDPSPAPLPVAPPPTVAAPPPVASPPPVAAPPPQAEPPPTVASTAPVAPPRPKAAPPPEATPLQPPATRSWAWRAALGGLALVALPLGIGLGVWANRDRTTSATGAADQSAADDEAHGAADHTVPPQAEEAATPAPAPAAPSPNDARAAFEAPWSDEEEKPDAPQGQLIVNSDPAGAIIFLDGAEVGVTPAQLATTAGEHTLMVHLPGYSSKTSRIRVAEGRITSFEFELTTTAPPGTTTGQASLFGPVGATVFVDGRATGKLPVTMEIQEGKHTFLVEAADGSRYTTVVDVNFPTPGLPAVVNLSAP